MSSGNKDTTKMTNGAGSNHNTGNVNNMANGNNSNIADRSSAADEPYFAHRRMHDRSAHVSRLSDQIDRTDEILKR